ncbi:tolloid-like protein 2 [Lytechinus variegatus]|uniref:tolloid-like protein 2 n=1 Tax=Lytechinus variegatus TaxID=7654 RepID=UPI001BB17E6F|nr:tolloid-like protein 2 [Lytechinus variegatus]
MKPTSPSLSLFVSWILVVIALAIEYVRPCSDGEVQLGNEGQLYVISSPYFPDVYPTNLDCVYHMVAPTDRRVRIFFTSFTLENPNDLDICNFDYLAIYDGGSDTDSSLGRFCGPQNPPATITTGNELYVVFHTDSSIQKTGFRAEITDVPLDYVEPVPTPALGSCLHTYTEEHGVFYSPNFPDYYGNSLQCTYIVTSSKADNTILLRFPSFDVEESINCVYDYVEVRDGDTETSELLDRYCGASLPENTISSTGPAMFVRFRSDSSNVFKGFYAEYADSDTGFQDDGGNSNSNQFSVCDLSHAALTEKGGTIVSHKSYSQGSYDDSQYCTITIIASRAHERIFFDLIENDLPPSNDCGASGDYLQLLDGDASAQNSETLGFFCGQDVGRYTTENSFAVVRFISDSVPNPELEGFKLVYSIFYTDEYGCENGDWHCDNDRCIARNLICDGYDHCRDNSDEEKGCRQLSTRVWMIAVGVSAAIIIVVIFVGCLFYKWSHRKSALSPTYEASNPTSTSMQMNSADSPSPRSKTMTAFTISRNDETTTDHSPRRSGNRRSNAVEPLETAPVTPPPSYGDVAEIQEPTSYLEFGRRKNKSDHLGREPKLKPLSMLPSSEPTSESLPTGRRNVLPPINNDVR